MNLNDMIIELIESDVPDNKLLGILMAQSTELTEDERRNIITLLIKNLDNKFGANIIDDLVDLMKINNEYAVKTRVTKIEFLKQ